MTKVKNILLLIVCLFSVSAYGQEYFQQKVNFSIYVELNDSLKTLDGIERIQYFNHSPDTLSYIWFHLWPNAYKNDLTSFSKQLLRNGRTDFYFSSPEERGSITQLNFAVNGKAAMLEENPTYADVGKLILPSLLLPGDSIQIQTPFHVKLPHNFSRGGYTDESFQITQWYPKPAVYDQSGWHIMPYLEQGEFYNDFGNYQAHIKVPEKFIVAANGTEGASESSSNGMRTFKFSMQNVHDFAWFADPDFIIQQDTLQLKSGKIIDVEAYYLKESEAVWKNATGFIKDAVLFYSNLLGEYPYSSVKAVEARMGFTGGMEYPGITCISGINDEKSLDLILAHEVGHNWFYGILASNEREFPWMDEGMNTYYEYRYEREKYGEASVKKLPEKYVDLGYRIAVANKTDQPIETASQDFSYENYGYIAYHKAALWMQGLSDFLGQQMFDSIMKTYYEKWKFHHPKPLDFKQVAEDVSGKDLDGYFHLLQVTGPLHRDHKTVKVSGFMSLKDTDKYHYLFVSPAVGINYYDKFMAGALVHNYTLPQPPLHFFIAPMYGIKSKSFTGAGRLGYHFMSEGLVRKTEIALSGSHFNVNSFTDSTGKINYMPFTKVVPSIKLNFKNRSPLGKGESFIQWKTFFINETGLSFSRDTIEQQDIISYPQKQRNVHQLTLFHQNKRVLYPYSAMLRAETGKGFLRLGLEGNYFFNYPGAGGLSARFFAGKFFYLNRSNISRYETSRYHLNMTGANGYEDYTYSNYFVGRNEFEGTVSQQIMIKDGGFKIRTDLLNQKVGRTDDWLIAVNLNTPFPEKLNPLQVLPFKIPLKIFADIGTYAEAWQKNATTGKFLYNTGLQISLLSEIVNIYIPLIYSEVYRNYYKSTVAPNERFRKRISFSLDIQKFDFRNFLKKAGI